MNEAAELQEYLRVVEMKLQSLIQDVRNIQARLEPRTPRLPNAQPNFFMALQADDDNTFTVTHGQ